MRRGLLPAAVLSALAVASAGAAAAPAPRHLPAVALGAIVVWRVQIATVLFVALYAAIVTTRLALHGETLTRVGRDGIEVPRVGRVRDEGQAANDDLATSVTKLQAMIETLGRDAQASPHPTDRLLNDHREGA